MPRYKFRWENLPSPLLRGLKSDLGLQGVPADELRSIYGARPSTDFVRDTWPTLLDHWLRRDRSARLDLVGALRDRRLGDLSVGVSNATGQMEYLRSCRNSSTLRDLTTDRLIALGEQAPASTAQQGDASSATTRSGSWPQFASSLAASLSVLSEDQFLIIERKRSPHFVQFSAQGSFGLRAEMVSNSYLDPEARLSPEAIQAAAALGWTPPTGSPDESTPERDPDGSPNYFREWSPPVPFIDVALMTVDSMVQVLGVPHPGELAYHAFSADGADVLLPTLGLAPHQPKKGVRTDGESPPPPEAELTSEGIARRLLDVLRQVSGDEALDFDQDGDIPLRYGSTMVFVRVFGDPPVVRVFSLVLRDFTPSARLMSVINEMNEQSVFTKWRITDDVVITSLDLFGRPLVEQHVLDACGVVGDTVDGIDEQLQSDFGGRTFFGEYVHPKNSFEAHGYL